MNGERTPRVELVVDADCPNVEAARHVLARALSEVGLPDLWCERWQTAVEGDPVAAGEAGRLPSPTIVIDGEPVGGPAGGAGCRLYRDDHGRLVGAPPVDQVVESLRRALEDPT